MELRISELMDLYQDDSIRLAAGPVQDAERIRERTMKKLGIAPKHKVRRLGRTLLIAAAAAVLLMSAALAVYHWTLADRVVDVPDMEYVYEMMPMVDASGESYMEYVQVDAIPTTRPTVSLQGLAGSPANQAYVAWTAYKEQWDLDNANWWEPYGDDSYYETPEHYAYFYGAYLAEQAAKLDEIMEEYGLVLQERWEGYEEEADLYAILGTEDFLSEAFRNVSGYIYNTGTFKAEGWLSERNVGYSLFVTAEGTFTNVGGLNPDSEWFGDYEEWSFTAASGQELVLVLGDYRAQVLAQLPGATLTLSVYCGSLGDDMDRDSGGLYQELVALDGEALEKLAESIDFAVLSERFSKPYDESMDISGAMDAWLAAPEEYLQSAEVNEWIQPWESPEKQNELVLEALGKYRPDFLPADLKEWFLSTRIDSDCINGRVEMAWMIPEDLDTKTDFDLFLRYEPAENFACYTGEPVMEQNGVLSLGTEQLTGYAAAEEYFRSLASMNGCTCEAQAVQGWDGWKMVRADGTLEALMWYDEEAGLVFWMTNKLYDMDGAEFLFLAESVIAE